MTPPTAYSCLSTIRERSFSSNTNPPPQDGVSKGVEDPFAGSGAAPRDASYLSPLGWITLESDGERLTGLRFAAAAEGTETGLPVFRETARWLDVYFSGGIPGEPPPLALRGTTYQQAVWSLLLEIPRGHTVTYGELARRLSSSARAVGQAVGSNPIALIVPCHRVLGQGGRLTGYAYGLARKRALLRLEGIL